MKLMSKRELARTLAGKSDPKLSGVKVSPVASASMMKAPANCQCPHGGTEECCFQCISAPEDRGFFAGALDATVTAILALFIGSEVDDG